MSDGVEPRVLAARIVQAVLFSGRSLKAVLTEQLPALPDARDRALTEAMVLAVIRHRVAYAAALDRMTPRSLGKRDADLRSLLYVGMAQLLEMQLPAHAALATTVDAARALGRAHQAGMVNAILRRVQREGIADTDPALEWPEFLREAVVGAYADADAVFSASALKAPMFLRVNPRLGSRDEYLAQLHAAEIDATVVAAYPLAIELPVAVPVMSLPGFEHGLVSVQDLSAQLAAVQLDLHDGLRILDACAAPGGKTAAMLELCTPTSLVALDNSARRLAKIRATLARTGTYDESIVKLQQADARHWQADSAFDRILLDVPCSSTGVVRRQPDVLLHRRPEDIQSLVATQAELLEHAWSLLKPGGLLLYTTCSILPPENALQIRHFLGAHPDAHCEAIESGFYGNAVWVDDLYCGHQRLPGDLAADGFFYARLRKGLNA